MLILKRLTLHKNCAERGRRGSTVVGLRGTASRGISGRQADGACQLNETIITYLGNLSIGTYKWFGCCGIAASKAEIRNVKIETGRQRESKPAPLCKTKAQRVRHPPGKCATRNRITFVGSQRERWRSHRVQSAPGKRLPLRVSNHSSV